MPSPRRVVITGVGPIAAIGIGREDFWLGLEEGREGRRPAERIEADGEAFPRLAECLDFFIEDYLESEKTYLDRCSAFVLAACRLAFDDAGLDWRELNGEGLGLSLGTAFGCLDSMHNVTARVQGKGLRFASPMIFTHSFANSPASLAAIEYGIAGAAPTFCAGDVSAASAIQYAFDLVRWGRAEVMLAGGADALSEALLAGIAGSREACEDNAPGEGACLLTLESAEGAAARGANILAEIVDVSLGDGGDCGEASGKEYQATETYGHCFGASFALNAAAGLWGLSCADSSEVVIRGRGRDGQEAAMALRRFAE